MIKAELIHRDYAFGESAKTFGERFIEAVKRSNLRRDAIAQQVLAGQKSFSTPVTAGSGEYLMAISFGTPAQSVSAIMDTGSDLVWTQCLPCQNCYAQNGPTYDPSKSSTYKKEGCSSALCLVLPHPPTLDNLAVSRCKRLILAGYPCCIRRIILNYHVPVCLFHDMWLNLNLTSLK